MDERRIDFSKIKWGTLTDAQKRYHKKHPMEAKNLKSFASLVLRRADEFPEKTVRRARFYKNVLLRND